MKRTLFYAGLSLALAASLVPGCATTTGDGGNDDDGPYPADSLDEGQAVANPLAEEWDADAFCFSVVGFQVDENGHLRGPETLACESDEWLFRYTVNAQTIFNVAVNYSGSYDTWEDPDYRLDTHYELPDYSNGNAKDLMNLADGEFEENLGYTDDVYMLALTALETYNQAFVTAFDPSDFSVSGWIILDADTLDILGSSW